MKQHKVRNNTLKAQLRTPMFKMQQQTPKKGKGSYSRKGRHAQKGSSSIAMPSPGIAAGNLPVCRLSSAFGRPQGRLFYVNWPLALR